VAALRSTPNPTKKKKKKKKETGMVLPTVIPVNPSLRPAWEKFMRLSKPKKYKKGWGHGKNPVLTTKLL
jgi:hypothetical protein